MMRQRTISFDLDGTIDATLATEEVFLDHWAIRVDVSVLRNPRLHQGTVRKDMDIHLELEPGHLKRFALPKLIVGSVVASCPLLLLGTI